MEVRTVQKRVVKTVVERSPEPPAFGGPPGIEALDRTETPDTPQAGTPRGALGPTLSRPVRVVEVILLRWKGGRRKRWRKIRSGALRSGRADDRQLNPKKLNVFLMFLL